MLLHYLKPYKRQCIIGPVCKLIEAILEVLLPTIMAVMINEGIMRNDIHTITSLGILMFFMVTCGFGFSLICQYNAARASQGFGTDMRNALFQKITSFSYADIDHFTSLSLTNRLTTDIQQLQLAVAMLIRLVIRSPFIIFGTIIISMFLDLQLSLILLASIPFIALLLYVFIKKSTPLYRTYQIMLDRLASLLSDHFSGIRVIRAFVTQRQEKQRFDCASDDLAKQMRSVAILTALLHPLSSLIVNGAVMVLLYTGLIQIVQEQTPPGNLIAFINYAAQILLALVAISNLIVIFTKAAASTRRIQEVFDHTSSMQEGTKDYQNTHAIALSLQHVYFQYGDGNETLKDITLDIEACATIGVIGGTGSGKSTLAALLCRFYDVSAGGIEVFGHPIKEYTNASLQKRITIVPQNNALMKGTVRDNLWFGLPQGDDKELMQALQDAQASDFVLALPNGFDTMLQRGGTNLSGGQRQRLCIARALLRKSNILLFDDAGSALDFKTEAKLRQALKKRQQTQIIISQRVASILHADRIIVLDNGEVVGYASHTELFDTCKHYQDICATQQIGRTAYV